MQLIKLDVANYFPHGKIRELLETPEESLRRYETKALDPLKNEVSKLVVLLEVRYYPITKQTNELPFLLFFT